MEGASWRQSEHLNDQLAAAVQKTLRTGTRANRRTRGIVLILIVAVAIGFLVSAILALVGTENLS